MKESVLDVLMFLLDNYSEDGTMDDDDRDELAGRLANMGFEEGEIDHAFDWLDSWRRTRTPRPISTVNRGAIGPSASFRRMSCAG